MSARKPAAAPMAAIETQMGDSSQRSHRVRNQPPKKVDFSSMNRAHKREWVMLSEVTVMIASVGECGGEW